MDPYASVRKAHSCSLIVVEREMVLLWLDLRRARALSVTRCFEIMQGQGTVSEMSRAQESFQPRERARQFDQFFLTDIHTHSTHRSLAIRWSSLSHSFGLTGTNEHAVKGRTVKVAHAADRSVVLAISLCQFYTDPLARRERGRAREAHVASTCTDFDKRAEGDVASCHRRHLDTERKLPRPSKSEDMPVLFVNEEEKVWLCLVKLY